jgi:hypothetical protein
VIATWTSADIAANMSGYAVVGDNRGYYSNLAEKTGVDLALVSSDGVLGTGSDCVKR